MPTRRDEPRASTRKGSNMSKKDPTLAEVRAELKGDIADVARTVSKIAKDQTKIIDLIVSVRAELKTDKDDFRKRQVGTESAQG